MLYDASLIHPTLATLVEKLTAITGVNRLFNGPFFHETVLHLEKPVNEVLRELTTYNILGGYNLTEFYPQLGNNLLVCATEMRTEAEMDHYSKQLQAIMKK